MDLRAALKTFYNSEATGFIIWGSSSDVKTVDKCEKLLHYIETIFGPAIAKYTRKTDDVSPSKDNDSYNETNMSTTHKQEADDVVNEIEKENKTTIDDDKHHIQVIEVGTHIRPEVAAELNQTLWKSINMTVLDAIVQTWLLNLEHKDLNKSVEMKNMTTSNHILSDTSNDVFNITYTNVSIYATENPIDNNVIKGTTTTINTLTESPINEKVLINLDEEIINRKKSNISKNLKKGLPKLNLSEISIASESEEDYSLKNNTTQTLNLEDKNKGVPEPNLKPVTEIVPPSTAAIFTTKVEIVTTTEMSIKSSVSKNGKKGRRQFQDLDSTDVSQVSEETYEKPSDNLKKYENTYTKEGLMSFQPESEIIHNFLDLSKEEFNSRSIEMSEKKFRSKNIKKGLSKSIHIQHFETTTEHSKQDIAYEGETTEHAKVTTDKVIATTEENLTVTTEEITNSTVQFSTGITTEEVTLSDNIGSSTKYDNVAESLTLTTDKIEHLEVAKKGVERSIVEDAEEKSADSLDSEKEQVVVYV